MRSILVASAARILHVSRILRDNGTLTHCRGLRDGGMRRHRGRDSTYDPSAPDPLDGSTVPRSGLPAAEHRGHAKRVSARRPP